MRVSRYLNAGLFAGVFLLLAACGGSATDLPPTAEPTAEVILLPTPAEPTQGQVTEPAAPPSGETPAAPVDPNIPAIVNENLSGVSILRTDPFDQLDPAFWDFDPALATVNAGSLNITGNKNWATGLRLKRPVVEGQAIMIKFQMQKGANFGIQLSNGTPGTPEYRSYGFYRPEAVMLSRVFEGTVDIRQDTPLKGELKVHRFNTWYYCLLGVKSNGHFFLLIWDPADPTKNNRVHDTLNESWMGKEWAYTIEIHDKTLVLDEAVELQFEDIH